MKINTFLLLVFTILSITLSGLQFGLYYFFVKPIVVDQIYERGKSIGYGFTQALATPLKANQYEPVKEIVKITASLDGIAYVFITNGQNELIASSVNQSVHFSEGFLALMKQQDLSITSLVVQQHTTNTYTNVRLDGQSLYQVSLPISGGDFIGYIAMFNTDVEKALGRVLIPQIILMTVMLFAALFFLTIIHSAIVFPLRKLKLYIKNLRTDNVYERIDIPALKEINDIGKSLDDLREHLRDLLNKCRKIKSDN